MLIVTGHLEVDAHRRDDYLATCVEAVRLAREADGCLDFAISADLLDPGRVNVLERWRDQGSAEAFRAEGLSDEQQELIRSGEVAEYDVGAARDLMG